MSSPFCTTKVQAVKYYAPILSFKYIRINIDLIIDYLLYFLHNNTKKALIFKALYIRLNYILYIIQKIKYNCFNYYGDTYEKNF